METTSLLDFSAHNRKTFIDQLTTEKWDILIVGGGITGCGIALDAASRGLRVALLEKNDFASGTSSKSTKLIHGGLRYLKQFEFGLVREVGSERAIVHALAPHLVVPERMLLPLYEKRGLGYWLTSIGLKIYDWLAGVKPEDQRKMLTRSQTLRAEPLLAKDSVKGGAIYAEYRTDDARLTIEIAKTAFRHGTVLLNYADVKSFVKEDGRVAGVGFVDRLTNTEHIIRATSVVNAAGPWVDEVREADGSLGMKRLHLSKGVHIVVPRSKLPVAQAIYFDVDDGRMIFAIPRGRTTYIGTTDTSYHDSKDEVYCTEEDALYLINAVNRTFSGAHLHREDVESSWAGLRPLIHEEGKSAADLSRKDEIFISPSGLISIAGGKLTGYRKMSERVVSLVVKRHFQGRRINPCCTAKLNLSINSFESVHEIYRRRDQLAVQLSLFGFDPQIASQLIECFGSETDTIMRKFIEIRRGSDDNLSLLRAQLHYCIEKEMVCTLSDFFIRRTGLLFFDIHTVSRYLDPISDEVSEKFNWSNERRVHEVATIRQLLLRAALQ